MSKKLLIVESPAKAKTIEKYLGADFSVKSSYGHIRDLEKSNDLGVDVANNYRPNYIECPGKDCHLCLLAEHVEEFGGKEEVRRYKEQLVEVSYLREILFL